MWLKDRGVDDIVAVDVAPERLERATAIGARAVVRAGTDDLRARLVELHGAETLMGREVVGTNIYLDFAAAPTILPNVIEMARRHARLVVVGVHSQPVPVDLRKMLASELTITTAISYPDELPDVIAALPRLGAKAASLISHHVPFADVLDAFNTAREPGSAKVMVDFPA
jgi:threonine dehydrogenase-like Zn-dependent dehydrogenase